MKMSSRNIEITTDHDGNKESLLSSKENTNVNNSVILQKIKIPKLNISKSTMTFHGLSHLN